MGLATAKMLLDGGARVLVVAGAEEARIGEAALFRSRRCMASLVGCEGGNGEHLRAGSPAGSVGSESGGGESVQNIVAARERESSTSVMLATPES